MNQSEIEQAVVAAKAATYVGNGRSAPASRLASHDLAWEQGPWRYLDSYFGGTNFSGQEVLWHSGKPVWAMGYFGHILRPDLIDAARAGAVIKAALGTMYETHGRFLGGMAFSHAYGDYVDGNEGDVSFFIGREVIRVGSETAYELVYHGGTIRD